MLFPATFTNKSSESLAQKITELGWKQTYEQKESFCYHFFQIGPLHETNKQSAGKNGLLTNLTGKYLSQMLNFHFFLCDACDYKKIVGSLIQKTNMMIKCKDGKINR